jgi:hypothetical protein
MRVRLPIVCGTQFPIAHVDEHFWHINLYRKHFPAQRSSFCVPIKHDLNIWQKFVRANYFGWVFVAGQSKCLTKDCDSASDYTTLHLLSISIISHSCLGSKSCEASDLLLMGHLLEVRIKSHRLDVGAPISPMCLPCLES